ncbi:MAG TPA: DUF222 domain-containing protein [Actinomycetota bacterium]
MSTLRSGLEELRGTELRFLSEGELEERLDEIGRASGVLEAERARTVAEIERRGAFALTGHLSITSWVEQRMRTSWSDAARQVRTARALEHMPAAREALYEGEVSTCAVGQLVDARETAPEEFSRSEQALVDAARTLPARDLRRVVAHWKELVDPDAPARADRERWNRRGLHVSPVLDGMVRVDGNLDPETGQSLITALRSVTHAWSRRDPEDQRTPAQRRCDALGEIARSWLERADRPLIGGERPHVTVTVDLETLEGRAGRFCELEEAGGISATSARRLACDARVSRVIMRGASEPLDVGRRTSVVPSGLRRAVVTRDRGCRFPGCDRPAPWCDAHHIVHWADGGDTKLRNLILLCRRHHRIVHDGFRLEMTGDGPVFMRPDGLALEDRAPP